MVYWFFYFVFKKWPSLSLGTLLVIKCSLVFGWFFHCLFAIFLVLTYLCPYIEKRVFVNGIGFFCFVLFLFVPSPTTLLFYIVFRPFIYNAISDVLGLISTILLLDFNFSKLFCILFSLLSWLLLYYSISLFITLLVVHSFIAYPRNYMYPWLIIF